MQEKILSFELWSHGKPPWACHLMWIHTYIFHKLRLPFSWLQKQVSLICPVSLCGSPAKAKTSTAVNNAVAGKHPKGEFAGYHPLAFSTHFPPVLRSLLVKGPEALEIHFPRHPHTQAFVYHLMDKTLNKMWWQFCWHLLVYRYSNNFLTLCLHQRGSKVSGTSPNLYSFIPSNSFLARFPLLHPFPVWNS